VKISAAKAALFLRK